VITEKADWTPNVLAPFYDRNRVMEPFYLTDFPFKNRTIQKIKKFSETTFYGVSRFPVNLYY